jgi:hypothetical protein
LDRSLFVLFGLMMLAAPTARAGHGAWEWLEEKRGVRLWKLSVPNQSLPGFRGETAIDGSIDQIVSEMLDAKHHTEWMHRCAESWIYQHTSDLSGILYNRTSAAPWPVWDRDVVLDVQFEFSADHRALTVRFKNLDDKLRPVPDRVVRMPKLVGFYKMVELSPGHTNVVYQVEVDIGGSIPDWIADEVAKDLPYYTLLSLRERVEGITEEFPVTAPTPVAIELPSPRTPRGLTAARE